MHPASTLKLVTTIAALELLGADYRWKTQVLIRPRDDEFLGRRSKKNKAREVIENGVLRGNAPAAASIGMLLKLPQLSKGPFRKGDPRAQHVSAAWDLQRVELLALTGAAVHAGYNGINRILVAQQRHRI